MAGCRTKASSRSVFERRPIPGRCGSERLSRSPIAFAVDLSRRGMLVTAFIEPVTLKGVHATLEPMSEAHVDELAQAATDGDIHALWYPSVAEPAKMREYVKSALAMRDGQGAMPFVARMADGGDVVGATRYF